MAKMKPTGKRQSWAALIGCGMLLCVAGTFESIQQPTGIAKGYLVSGQDQNNAAIQAAGEFRVVAANILWAKVVDHYHHQYMAQGGDWETNESLLPLLQTIIRLDPHFVEAYELMGGTILPRTGRFEQGKTVLAEGIKNNPYDWEIYREMAMLYAWRGHQPDAALPYAKAGLAQADDDFSKRLMATLCNTLQNRIREEQSGSPSDSTESPSDPQPKPVPAAAPPQSPPSA